MQNLQTNGSSGQTSGQSSGQSAVSNRGFVVLVQALIVAFWTGVMYWLCSICYNTASWFILLFPFIFGLILVFLVAIFASAKSVTQTQTSS